MRLIKVPYIIRKFNIDSLIWEIPSSRKVIYLTFDDGPIPEITPKILDLLKKYNAHATFFCVGDNIVKYPDLFNRLKEDGHKTGNHTQSHEKGHRKSNFKYFRSVQKRDKLHSSDYFRPPHGKFTLRQFIILRRKYNFILWSVMSYDFDTNISPKSCLHNVIRNAHPGSIIVFHDSLKAAPNMFYALEGCLRFFSRKGYTFEVLPELKNPSLSKKESLIQFFILPSFIRAHDRSISK